MKVEKWVLATRLDQVPNHNKIFIKWRNRENHMGKTLLQKEMKRIVPEDKNKKDDHEEHH